MSVLIKGMTFPKDGAYLATLDISVEDGYAIINIPNVGTFNLLEVQTPHGRLIDADEIIEEQNYTAKDTSVEEMRVACRYCAEVLKDAPTVIGAEEGSYADTTD